MTDHPLFAAVYDRIMAPAEHRALGSWREQLLAEARGRVLEVGAGTGQNLRRYLPSQVESVVVCEPDGAMRRRLAKRIDEAGEAAGEPPVVAVTVHPGGVPGLAFPDASFDTVVCTLVLCTVADVDGALSELRRLLTPEGRLLFIEHVRLEGVPGAAQRLLNPLWGHLAGGCRLDRDTISSIRRSGFTVTDCERPAPFGRWSTGIIVMGEAMIHQEAA